jgi:hypothetical protein
LFYTSLFSGTKNHSLAVQFATKLCVFKQHCKPKPCIAYRETL